MSRVQLAEKIFSIMPTMNRKFFSKLPHFDYPKQKLRLLHVVFHHDDEPMKFYVEKLYISKPNLSKLVDGMIDEGLLERHNDDKDRRITRIKITKEGKQIMTEHFEMLTTEVAKVFEVFTDDDVDQLNYHLEEIIKIFNKVE